MSTKAQIKHLEALMEHPGWQIMHEHMKADILSAAIQIAQNPNMPEKETDFRRGAIWAGNQLLTTPDRIVAKLRNDMAFEDAKAKTTSPTTNSSS